jgi:hypothetical protein
MKLIETRTLVTSSTSIVLSSIPQNFTDLVIKVSGRATGGSYDQTNCIVSINGSSSPYYRYLLGGGSGSGSSGQSNSTMIIWSISSNITTANTFGNGEMYIHNYTSTSRKFASADGVLENNATSSGLAIAANKWESSTAINTITLTTDSGDFAAGSTVSLYGIGGAGDGYKAPKATGGVISYSGNYIIHSFFASGTFTPTTNLTDVEYLVVAGGGGAGKNAGCGAGAGGYRSSVVGQSSGGGASAEARLSLTSGTAYTVTVGAGGAVGTGSNGNDLQPGSDGSISTFSTITSTGGGGSAPGGNVIGTNALTRHTGRTGGSGGGSSAYAPDGTTGPVAGGTAATGQGFAGGSATSSGDGIASAGGGGAGAVGESVTATAGQTRAGAGGAGVSSNITGSSIVRASGGSAWFTAAVAGGGGGTGQPNGIANTGGGAGDNGVGGSGIVIVRYPA